MKVTIRGKEYNWPPADEELDDVVYERVQVAPHPRLSCGLSSLSEYIKIGIGSHEANEVWSIRAGPGITLCLCKDHAPTKFILDKVRKYVDQIVFGGD